MSRVHGLAVLSLLALLLGCGAATTVIYEEGRRPERDLMALGPPWVLVTRTDMERLEHLDEMNLIWNMQELCQLYDQQQELRRRARQTSPEAEQRVASVLFFWQSIEELRWALILRGDRALDKVIVYFRETDLKQKTFPRVLARTLNKWRSEKATAALVDYGAELAARPDAEREIIHMIVCSIMYGRYGDENVDAFVRGERIGKLRDTVLRLVELGGSVVHCRVFNSHFPEHAIDLDAVGSPDSP